MRPRALALAIFLWAPAPLAFAQTAPAALVPDVSKAEYDAARLHPLLFDNLAVRMLAPANDDRMLELNTSSARAASWREGALAIGPIRFDIGSADPGRDGRQAHFAHIHLDDISVLGGRVSGTFDGRAATLRLSWPTTGN